MKHNETFFCFSRLATTNVQHKCNIYNYKLHVFKMLVFKYIYETAKCSLVDIFTYC